MSADSRSITTDALAVLGTIIDETVGRDAIHLAVEPVVAAIDLEPGTRITAPISGYVQRATYGREAFGIVDPFLTDTVKAGQRFLMVLLPRQIATLRHVWDHHAFPPSQAGGADLGVAPAAKPVTYRDDREAATEFLRSFAASKNLSYDELIRALLDWSGNYSEPWWSYYDENYEPVWKALETVLGTTVERGSIDLSCRGC